MSVIRPVKAEAPILSQPFTDKAGRLTPYGHKWLTSVFLRTGGFDDEFVGVLASAVLSQASALAGDAKAEAVRRQLGDALQQVSAQQTERLRSLFEEYRRSTDANMAQLIGGLGRPPQTRLVTFSANDTWRPQPDLRTIQIYAVGGGGGGAGGTDSANGGGGGGGASYSVAAIDARLLPASVSVTVGAAGAGGAAATNGGVGGVSGFGGYVVAAGGNGGLATGAGGAAKAAPGGMFFGGVGGDGGGTDGASGPNLATGCPGGGGGAYYVPASGPAIGGGGGAGAWRSTAGSGGGGEGGLNTGGDGGAGTISETFIGPGYGGGGGGTTSAVSGAGGAGFNGAGGGGGAARPGGARSGGAGGSGKVWVVEFY